MDVSLNELWVLVMDREACRAVIYEVAKSQNDWVTELNWIFMKYLYCVKMLIMLSKYTKSQQIKHISYYDHTFIVSVVNASVHY